MPYIPHTPEDLSAMLTSIGVSKIDALFDEIPNSLLAAELKIPVGINEMAMLKEAELLASQNKNGICFIGAGSYEHHIPAAVWELASRGEFLTAYTPYQAEASQGTLQLLYEYQTMIAELTGMEVANASLYDGATALAEAVLMAVRINGPSSGSARILVAGTLHPLYREALKTIICSQGIDIITLPFNSKKGVSEINAVAAYTAASITALIIANPNFFGCLEPVDEFADWAYANNKVCIACVNPISLAILKPPGQWGEHGVDLVVGEGQPLGCPTASGGPYFGFFSTKKKYVRQIPGRVVGGTVDQDGKPGYTLTLQAREQHIRRAKATSNICTNQGLLVTAATIYMSLLGAQGLAAVARQCHYNTQKLLATLTMIDGVSAAFPTPYFHEVLLKFNCPVTNVLCKLNDAGIAAGVSIVEYYPELPNTMLVCATEMRTDDEIAYYGSILKQIMTDAMADHRIAKKCLS